MPDFAGQVLAQAQRTPDAIAVIGPEGRLSYAALDELSAAVAGDLAGAGVTPGAVVGVCLGQDHRLPAVLLGAARAHAAYLPLDLEHPLDRLAYQVVDSGTRVLVGAGSGLEIAKQLAATAAHPVQVIDADTTSASTLPVPPREPAADDLAYLIYTSGSTGRPKGVEVTRGNLAVHLAGMAQVFPLAPDDVMTTIAGVSFDITHLGIWGPLTSGGTCVLLEKSCFADGLALSENLVTDRVTVLQATPTSLRTLAAADWPGSPDIRVMSGGEALDSKLARSLLPKTRELWNFYGPTEATIWATAARVTEAGLDPVTIGRPLPGYRVHIVDEAGSPVAEGATGELWISGLGVAKGYRRRPDLTGKVFGPDPWHPGERRYRTGDRVRRLANGTLECLGRLDHQVKVRGYRIELGEIEARLRESPAVSDAVVTVEDADTDAHLVGHVVWRAEADVPGLREFLAQHLPDYMVPHRWNGLDALPVLPSGKVDRAALPAVTPAEPENRGEAAVTPTEQFIAQIWAEVLEIPVPSRTDGFFALGGHSFAATLVAGRLRAALGCRISVRVLFEHPVLADFAAEVERIALDDLAAKAPAGVGEPV